jgi:hypothetical protein
MYIPMNKLTIQVLAESIEAGLLLKSICYHAR